MAGLRPAGLCRYCERRLAYLDLAITRTRDLCAFCLIDLIRAGGGGALFSLWADVLREYDDPLSGPLDAQAKAPGAGVPAGLIPLLGR